MRFITSKRITAIFAAFLLTVALTVVFNNAFAQDNARTFKYTRVDPEIFGDNAGHWYGIADKGNIINARPGKPKYDATDIAKIADNILLFQKTNGGWPKNYDMFAILTDDQKDSVSTKRSELNTTYDNGSTYSQITVLANVYTATKVDKYKTGALKGLDFVLKSQYKNGGWPQYYPLESNYSRCITYNDGVFEGIMQLLQDIKDNKPEFAFIDDKDREKYLASYDKGLDCIIKTQIVDNGKATAWCQQHDEKTLAPAWARKFEPPSICNQESANLVLFLMRMDKPQKEIINAIQSAVAWFQDSKIYETRVDRISAPRMVTPYRVSTSDRVVVHDEKAPPIWTRYYEIGTHKPLFCNRTSIVCYSLAEVDRERRDGYGWYTYAPQKVLDKYHDWQKKWAPEKDVLTK